MPGSKRNTKMISLTWVRISTLSFSDVRLWWKRRMPILEWAPKYRLQENLLPDTVSGMMLTVQQVAQGLAFALMSSVHPVFGLYGSLFPPLIYAIFGMGRHVSTGTFAITSMISAGAVERLVSPNNGNVTNSSLGVLGISDFEMQRIEVAAAVTFLGGIIQVSMFVLHLGSATLILSEPVVSSMTTGAATHVVTSQVKYLLGIKVPYMSRPLGMFYTYTYIFNNIRMIQIEVMLLSILCIVVLLLVKQLNQKFKSIIKIVIPIDLILIITASLACYYGDMESAYSMHVVGHIPKGIPLPQVPPMDILSEVIFEAFGVALVGYTVSIFLAYNSANKFKYSVDENQELLAHGLSNLIPSFFFCIPNAGAPARSFLLCNNGAKTQVACLISCLLILLVIYFIVPFLYWLPMCVLASIVIVSLKGMLMQFRDLKKYWNVDKVDCVIWVCTYLVTICFAANVGLFFGVVFSVAVGIFRLTRVKVLHLTDLDEAGSKMIEDTHCELSQKVKIIYVATPVFFLNAKKLYAAFMKINKQLFTDHDLNKCKTNVLLSPVSNEANNGEDSISQSRSIESNTVILDCSGITFSDFTGVTMLAKIYFELKNSGAVVLLTCCNVSLVQGLQYSGIRPKYQTFFDTVNTALRTMQLKKNRGLSLESLDSTHV